MNDKTRQWLHTSSCAALAERLRVERLHENQKRTRRTLQWLHRSSQAMTGLASRLSSVGELAEDDRTAFRDYLSSIRDALHVLGVQDLDDHG